MRALIVSLLLAVLAGCASGPRIDDTTYHAKSQSSRVKFLIIHYTVLDRPESIRVLTQQEVSAHYLLTDEADPIIYRLVDETRVANQAGISFWKDYTRLNVSSIGIEIVNPGFKETPNGRVYAPYPEQQIDTLIKLVKDITQRHQIPPENVLGHSDIAPQRKQDPGPQFPWKRLADAGLVIWPDAARVAAARPAFEAQLPDAAWFQKMLATHGYSVPQNGQFDDPTRTVISAFQMKYRNTNIDGMPDAETAAILAALVDQQTKK